MAMSAGTAEGEPMMDINTTPLIDVMLVLLIMFIITIPIQTHAVKLDLPTNSNDPSPPINTVKNKVVITPQGQIMWNGTPITLPTLRSYLALTLQLPTEPELHLQPDPQARYELVDQVLAVTKRSGVTKMGFVGNEAYGNF